MGHGILKKQKRENNFFIKINTFTMPLSTYLQKPVQREASIQKYFIRNGVSAITIVYEDFINHPERTILETLEYLEISTDNIKIPEIPFQRTADDLSEEWVNSFQK